MSGVEIYSGKFLCSWGGAHQKVFGINFFWLLFGLVKSVGRVLEHDNLYQSYCVG